MNGSAQNATLEALTAGQKRTVAALLTAPDVTSAAAALGVSPSTVWAHLRNPAVKAALRSAQDAVMQETMNCLVRLAKDAVGTLGDILANGSTDHARLQAARTILDALLRYRESILLEERIKAIESALEDVKGEGQHVVY
jgi:predicted DNA binding protein